MHKPLHRASHRVYTLPFPPSPVYAPLQREGHFPDATPAASSELLGDSGSAAPVAMLSRLAGLEASLPGAARLPSAGQAGTNKGSCTRLTHRERQARLGV